MNKKEYEEKINEICNKVSDIQVNAEETAKDIKEVLSLIESLPELDELDEEVE